MDAFTHTLPLQQLAISTRFAVQAEQRMQHVVDTLVGEAYCYAQDQQMRYGLMTCDPALHDLFEHYGFREYLPPAVLRMALVIDDAEHLQACGAPLVNLVRGPVAGAAARGWLQRNFRLLD